MSVTRDILASYRRPRAVFRARVGDEPREDRALVVLMVACTIIFVAQWPRLARLAFETGQDVQPLIGGALFGLLFIAPLAMYAIGTLSHIVAKLLGAKGSGYRARLALFWSLLCASPLWLLWGLTAGFVGPGPALTLTGLVALGVFILFWALNFLEAEWG